MRFLPKTRDSVWSETSPAQSPTRKTHHSLVDVEKGILALLCPARQGVNLALYVAWMRLRLELA